MDSKISRNSNIGIKNYSCYMAMDNDGSPTSGTPRSLDGYLSKVLCNLEEAATYDKECCAKIADLKSHQQQLTNQITELETREAEGIKLLQKADVMWSCMEESYKKKIQESIEMQKQHLKEQREFEQNLSKWRQNRKDLESQVKSLDKCKIEIKEKMDAKKNDLKFINTEIGDLKKKIQTTETEAEILNKSLTSKHQAAGAKQAELADKLKSLKQDLEKVLQEKADKETEGRKCIKQAREDLQKICTKLLQKRMENEDLKAEREAILSEIELLKATSEQCKERCENRKAALAEELTLINADIANYRLKCIQCHKCVDTLDVRRFCTDCPRCMEETRECIYNVDTCTEDPENECVCMETKRRFLDNVFENMYNVLAAQIKTKNGKALAEQIFDSLKKSRNGKLPDPTRRAVQDFVLTVVKKNLNLTIIGGAVKTRCEMEPATYDQLMLCLNKVEVEKPEKEDKAVSKKEPCKRWGVGECNCPKGPAGCVCLAKAAPTAKDPQPCPPRLAEDYLDIGEAKKCPNRNNMDCGADCAVPPRKLVVPEKIAKGYQATAPCSGKTCANTKTLKTAECSPMCRASLESRTSSKLNVTTSEESKGSQNVVTQMSQCSKECSESHSKAKKDGSRRTGESPTFTKNMRAAQCALGPCSTQDYDDPLSNSPTPYRKLIAKGPKTLIDDWKPSSNVGTDVLKSYSPAQNDCDCKLTRKRKTTGSRSCRAALISKKSSDHGHERRGIIKGNDSFCSDLIEVDLVPSKFIDVPRVQAEVLSGANVDRGTEPQVHFTNQERIALERVVSNLTKPHISKYLKVIIPNVKGEVKQEFTEITVTSSGSMAIALEEKIIEEIGNLTEENQVLLGVLRKTFSGHYALEFNKSAASSAVSRQVVLKKTDSGHVIMEIHKDIVETLRPGADTQVMSKVSSMSIGETRIENCQNKCYDTGHVQAEYKKGVGEVKRKYDKTRQSFKYSINQSKQIATGGKKSRNERMRNHLLSSNRAVGRQESLQSYKTGKKKQKYTTKTSNILYLKDEFQKMFELGKTALNVTIVGRNGLKSIIKARITKTQSRHIAVDVNALENIGQIANRLKNYPVSLIKTKSKYLLKLGRNNENANALLRRNSIGDMLVVLMDPSLKYPGNMSEVMEINETVLVARVKGIQLDDSDELSLLLRVTNSDNFVFILDKEFEQTYMKTVNKFGPDKCPVNLSINESEGLIIDIKSCDIHSNGLLFKTESGKLKIFNHIPNFEELQLYRSTIQTDVYKLFSKLYREHSNSKCCSDTLLNGKVDMFDSKVSFLNDKKYISSTGNFLVPIKVTENGELINSLTHYHKRLHGSVRISNSGNIYTKDIDEKAVEAVLSGSSSVERLHFIGSLVDTRNKRVSTSCLMQNSECYDDNQFNSEELSPETSTRWLTAENSPSCSCNPCCSNHYGTGFVSPHGRCSNEENPSGGSPIGILRTTHAKLKYKPKVKKQNIVNKSISWKDIIEENVTHCKIDFHEDQKLFCNINNKEKYRPDLSCLDYLDSMPPQLPSFLRDYQYS